MKTQLLNSPIWQKFNSLHYVIIFLFISTLYVTIGNLFFAEGSFFHVSDYTVSLFGKYLCYALLALAVDLVWDIAVF